MSVRDYVGLALLALVSATAAAHHSFGLYSEQVSELEGEIIALDWRNPHVRFTLKSTNDSDKTWTLEAGAGYILTRRGLAQELFQVGDRVWVAGRVHAGQPELLWLHNMLLGDGRELLMIGGVEPRWTMDSYGGDGNPAVVDALTENRGFFRVWSQPVLRPITFGAGLPFREEPIAGSAELTDRLTVFAARCEPVGMPGIMATPYPFEFVDEGALIRLRGFSSNAAIDRAIHLGEQTVSGSRMGYSAGRWENDSTLVVTTVDIHWPYFDDSAGTPQSDRLEIVEVFSLSDDQRRLDYEMIVTDPVIFSEPATAIQTYWLALGESLVQPSDCSTD